MSFEDFTNSRESLNYKGEMYKHKVIEYYESLDYILEKSSSFEGILSDIVMKNSEQKRIWIETKDSKVSIFAKSNFKRELIEYFYHWLLSGKSFELHIFVKDLSKKEETKEVLTLEAKKIKTLEWFEDQEGLDLKSEIIQKISEANDDLIYQFFSNTHIKIATGFQLHEKIIERVNSRNTPIQRYGKKMLSESENRLEPLTKRNEIIFNILPIEYPTIFYFAYSKFKLTKTAYEKAEANFPGEDLPAITIPRFESGYPKIRSFDSRLKYFFKSSIQGRVFTHDTNSLEWQRKRELLNRSLRHFLYLKGLRRDGYDYYFAYEDSIPDHKTDDEIEPIIIEGKRVTRPLYTESGQLNFVEHHSLNIRLDEYNDEIIIYIFPGFLFTYDGIERITDDHASRISRKYLNPLYNRNSNKRSELKFWENFLTSNIFKYPKDPWIDEFKILKMKRLTIRWCSESFDLNTERLDSFMK